MQAVAKKPSKKAKSSKKSDTYPPYQTSQFGRPTTYKPEYCDSVIEHLSTGKSFEGWCGVNMVMPSTAYAWMKKYPDFLEAVKLGRLRGMNNCEDQLLGHSNGDIKGNFNALQWLMKNRFSEYWLDKIEKEVTHKVKPAIIERLDGSEIELGTIEVEGSENIPLIDSGEDE